VAEVGFRKFLVRERGQQIHHIGMDTLTRSQDCPGEIIHDFIESLRQCIAFDHRVTRVRTTCYTTDK
jgi:hypothetical protein